MEVIFQLDERMNYNLTLTSIYIISDEPSDYTTLKRPQVNQPRRLVALQPGQSILCSQTR